MGIYTEESVQQEVKDGLTEAIIRNVSKDVYDIFEMTKFTELMQVEKALRELDVAGVPTAISYDMVTVAGAYGGALRCSTTPIR